MRVTGRLVSAGLVTAVLAGCSAPAAVTAPASPAGDGAYAHLAELQRITDAAGGTRSTPSPGYDDAVDHVAAVLRAAGWDVSTPSYEVEGESGTGYRNVIAQTRTGDPGHVVMAGAHLDSVPEGPGINDNGSGVAALLQIAEQLGGSPDLSGTVRLGFWGSEEDEPRGLHRLRRRPRRGPRARPSRSTSTSTWSPPPTSATSSRAAPAVIMVRATTRPGRPGRRRSRRCSPRSWPGSAPPPRATSSTGSRTTTPSSKPASRPAGSSPATRREDRRPGPGVGWAGRPGVRPLLPPVLRPSRRRRPRRARPVHRRGRRDLRRFAASTDVVG